MVSLVLLGSFWSAGRAAIASENGFPITIMLEQEVALLRLTISSNPADLHGTLGVPSDVHLGMEVDVMASSEIDFLGGEPRVSIDLLSTTEIPLPVRIVGHDQDTCRVVVHYVILMDGQRIAENVANFWMKVTVAGMEQISAAEYFAAEDDEVTP